MIYNTLQKTRAIPAHAYRRFDSKRLNETHIGVLNENAYMKRR